MKKQLGDFEVSVLRRRERVRKLLVQFGFIQRPALQKLGAVDYYYRILPFRLENALRAYVSHDDGEIRLIYERGKQSESICKSKDPREIENVLTKRKLQLRHPRT